MCLDGCFCRLYKALEKVIKAARFKYPGFKGIIFLVVLSASAITAEVPASQIGERAEEPPTASQPLQSNARRDRTHEPDPWWSPDKAMHFGLSWLATSLFGLTAAQAGLDFETASVAAGGLMLSLGLGKEVWDDIRPGGTGFSWRDMAWNSLGVLAGGATLVIINSLAPQIFASP